MASMFLHMLQDLSRHLSVSDVDFYDALLLIHISVVYPEDSVNGEYMTVKKVRLFPS